MVTGRNDLARYIVGSKVVGEILVDQYRRASLTDQGPTFIAQELVCGSPRG